MIFSPSSVASGCERLPQIANEGSCNTIGKNQPVHDPMFFAVRDPSNEPDLAIDALDIDASREGVFDNDGLGERRIGFFLGHSPTHVAVSDHSNQERGDAKYDRTCTSVYCSDLNRRRRPGPDKTEEPQLPEHHNDTAHRESAAEKISRPIHCSLPRSANDSWRGKI